MKTFAAFAALLALSAPALAQGVRLPGAVAPNGSTTYANPYAGSATGYGQPWGVQGPVGGLSDSGLSPSNPYAPSKKANDEDSLGGGPGTKFGAAKTGKDRYGRDLGRNGREAPGDNGSGYGGSTGYGYGGSAGYGGGSQ